MKIRKMILQIIIISAILISIPTQIQAWLQYTTYEECNTINSVISWILKLIAFIISISYITGSIQYLKHSKIDKKQKIKNILTWLIVSIIQITFFIFGALWVSDIGMETYWTSGERFQFKEIDGYIANGIRIIALILIIIYMITASIYFIKSKKEKIRKIENIIRWQIITSAMVVGLLILATNW